MHPPFLNQHCNDVIPRGADQCQRLLPHRAEPALGRTIPTCEGFIFKNNTADGGIVTVAFGQDTHMEYNLLRGSALYASCLDVSAENTVVASNDIANC